MTVADAPRNEHKSNAVDTCRAYAGTEPSTSPTDGYMFNDDISSPNVSFLNMRFDAIYKNKRPYLTG